MVKPGWHRPVIQPYTSYTDLLTHEQTATYVNHVNTIHNFAALVTIASGTFAKIIGNDEASTLL